MNKDSKQFRKGQKAVIKEVRGSFQQDFDFFKSVLNGWPLQTRLKFCFDVIMRKF